MDMGIRDIRQKFFDSEESRLFMLGSCMLILWVTILTILYRTGYSFGPKMLKMGLAHAGGGRAVSITVGMNSHIPRGVIALLAAYLDVMIMFIVYPILIFSYKNLFERKFFREYVGPIFDTAQQSLKRLRKLKIVGIFFFVWFPLWMTGILVGAVIGFLLGLRTWVTMTTVISGTICAIIMWVYVLGELFEGLEKIHPVVRSGTAVVIIVALLLWRLRSLKQRKKAK